LGVILYSAFGSLFFSDYLAKIQWGITAALDEHPGYGCKIVILPRGKDLSEIDERVIGSGVDGLLISTICDFTLHRMQDLAQAVERRWKRPIVALNIGKLPKSRISTVSFSNRGAAYNAVTHLLKNGHEKIGLIYTDDGSTDVSERVDGYREALADHHISYEAQWSSRGNFMPESGYQATLELFKRPDSSAITALFCTNDEMAFGAIDALRGLKKRCPQDVAVMGFDGLAMGEQVRPRLSTVEQPFFEIAKAGTKLLLDLVDGRQKEAARLVVPTKLIIRDSA
jgi:DNA-binding LacI/PurR family transcriptional regulator